MVGQKKLRWSRMVALVTGLGLVIPLALAEDDKGDRGIAFIIRDSFGVPHIYAKKEAIKKNWIIQSM